MLNHTTHQHPTVLRYIVPRSGRPPMTHALAWCESMRFALIKYSNGLEVFSGHAPDGSPLQGNRHAYIFAEPDEDGCVGHLSVYCADGFGGRAQAAAAYVEQLRLSGGGSCRVVLATRSHTFDIAGQNRAAGQSPIFDASCTWHSITPFISIRHPKTNKKGQPKHDHTGLQIGSAAHEIHRLTADMDLPPIVKLEEVAQSAWGSHAGWTEYHTNSQSGGARGAHHGTGFRIKFERPIHGPLMLGFGAHRGLGVFTAIPRVYTLKRSEG